MLPELLRGTLLHLLCGFVQKLENYHGPAILAALAEWRMIGGHPHYRNIFLSAEYALMKKDTGYPNDGPTGKVSTKAMTDN